MCGLLRGGRWPLDAQSAGGCSVSWCLSSSVSAFHPVLRSVGHICLAWEWVYHSSSFNGHGAEGTPNSLRGVALALVLSLFLLTNLIMWRHLGDCTGLYSDIRSAPSAKARQGMTHDQGCQHMSLGDVWGSMCIWGNCSATLLFSAETDEFFDASRDV